MVISVIEAFWYLHLAVQRYKRTSLPGLPYCILVCWWLPKNHYTIIRIIATMYFVQYGTLSQFPQTRTTNGDKLPFSSWQSCLTLRATVMQIIAAPCSTLIYQCPVMALIGIGIDPCFFPFLLVEMFFLVRHGLVAVLREAGWIIPRTLRRPSFASWFLAGVTARRESW